MAALIAGREYYHSINNYEKLTSADEQALANDISTMR